MKPGIRVALVAGLLLAGSLVPVVTAQTQSGVTIEEVRYAGRGDVSTAEAALFLWQSDAHQFDVVIATGTAIESAEVCLVGGDGGRELACQSASLAADSVETVAVDVPEWPLNLTGEQSPIVEVRDEIGQVVAEKQLTATVIRKTGDRDADGLSNEREATLGTSILRADTDDDGLTDRFEVETYQTEPLNPDTDGDGLPDGDGLDDGSEVLTHGTNPNARDTDSDGLTDAAELGRGTDPTAPTADRREGVLQRTVVFASRRPAVLLTGGLVLLAAVAAGLYWSDRDLRRSIGWLGDAGTGSSAAEGVDSAVLTNEERVQRLLDENGGRMLQSDMVEAADWSKATVSRVLSEMEENGAVTRIDVGKGNLVARPGDEPNNSNAPFSDQ